MNPTLRNRRKVLIVNTDPAEADAIASLISCCFDSDRAGTMREALTKLNNGGIVSCIVIDPLLPNGTGVGMIDRLRKLFPQIPLLVVLSLGVAPAEEYRQAGITHVLPTPLDINTLRKHLFQCVAEDEADKAVSGLREESAALKTTVHRNSAILKNASNL